MRGLEGAQDLVAQAVGERRAASGEEVYGRVVNTTSEGGLLGFTVQVNYVAAKAGIAAFTVAVAREMEKIRRHGERHRPARRTRMIESASRRTSAPSESFDDRSPDNVAPVVAWLASPEASHITGQMLHVYGSTIIRLDGWSVGRSIDAGGRP